MTCSSPILRGHMDWEEPGLVSGQSSGPSSDRQVSHAAGQLGREEGPR